MKQEIFTWTFQDSIVMQFEFNNKLVSIQMTKETTKELIEKLEHELNVSETDNWIKFSEETPPKSDDPTNPGAKYYEVMLYDGTIHRFCWWLNCWYCSLENGNVKYWRQIEDAN